MSISSVTSNGALTQLYSGLSTDAFPTTGVLAFALLIEEDTGVIHRYSGTNWNIATFGIL